MLWIALHLPALSLEAFAATLSPAQTELPAALVEAHRIVQANAAARGLGVRPGLKRATALALAPDLLLGQADAQRDAQALLAVAHVALAFTPAVAMPTLSAGAGQGAGQEVLLEVQSSLRYFGGITALLRQLKAALQPLAHQVQLATAPTALGAALLARWRADLEDGPHSMALGPLRDLLDGAPVALLSEGAEHAEALQGMGLRSVADLRALPRDGLTRRFGPELLLALDRARGDAPEPHKWLELPPQFSSRVELFTRADRSEQLMAGAAILLARLVAWAQARRGRIARFTLVMHHESGRHDRDDDGLFPRASLASDESGGESGSTACTELLIALAEPALDAQHLRQLLAERLARLPLAAPALELSLRCAAVVPGEAPNDELFPTRASEQAGLTRLVERLQARLGHEQVRCLELVQDHRPERATVTRPAEPARIDANSPAGSKSRHWPSHCPNHLPISRPVWLCPEPQPLRERAASPLLDGQALRLLVGPERIESGWWDDGMAARDYFIADSGQGALVWIYRTRLPAADAGGSWFLHGRFA